MVDLGRWLDGTYCVSDPIEPTSQVDGDAEDTDT
jgi:endogenous inhibitor of DNA gyrase (YacG/DUF329 family)